MKKLVYVLLMFVAIGCAKAGATVTVDRNDLTQLQAFLDEWGDKVETLQQFYDTWYETVNNYTPDTVLAKINYVAPDESTAINFYNDWVAVIGSNAVADVNGWKTFSSNYATAFGAQSIIDLQTYINGLLSSITDKDNTIANQTTIITEQTESLTTKDNTIVALNTTITNQNTTIANIPVIVYDSITYVKVNNIEVVSSIIQFTSALTSFTFRLESDSNTSWVTASVIQTHIQIDDPDLSYTIGTSGGGTIYIPRTDSRNYAISGTYTTLINGVTTLHVMKPFKLCVYRP